MSSSEQLIGQISLKACLDRAVFASSGQAFLFIGPKGIGKHSFGRAFAKGLLCENPPDFTGCGRCVSCNYMEHATHPDYREILLEDGDKTIKISKVREVLCGDVHILPQISTRKIYFIEGDYLNEQSQNAILKTLEDLAEYAVIILTASRRQILLPTLLSRVIPLHFARNTAPEMKIILSSVLGDEPADLDFIAGLSEGIPGIAMKLSDHGNLSQLRKEVLERMFHLHQSTRAQILTEQYRFFDENKEEIDLILAIILYWIRDMMIYILNPSDDHYLNGSFREIAAQVRISEHYSMNDLLRAARAVSFAAKALEQNSGYENCICNMLLQITKEESTCPM